MDPRRRNIILGIAGALLLLICCCGLLTLAGLLYLVPWESGISDINTPPEGRVEVVTPVATRLGTRAATRPLALATPLPGTPEAPGPVATLGAETPPSPAGTPVPIGAGGNDEAILAAKANMPTRDLRDLALRLKPGVNDIPATVNPTPPSYKVGDRAQFWVQNSDTQEYAQVTAVLRYMTDHLSMWVDEQVDLDDGDIKRSADRFEKETYPTNREFFGSEWSPGVDNDTRLNILHATGMGSNVAGYYSSADEFSRLVNQYSNEREMFYIAAEDDSSKPNTDFYASVLAHEFQHMIHWANDRNEDSWVNEGMSELAASLNGYGTGGHEYSYAERPDTQLTTWSDISEGNSEHYGASYLFMNYFLGRFGEDLTKAVVSSPENGAAGFTDALAKAGRSESFDAIFADWLVANYLDQPRAEPQKHFGYGDIDPPQPAMHTTVRSYPKEESTNVSQYGADYIQLKGSGDLTIDFEGQTAVGLVATQPRGRYAWWSHRGDDSDMTLTRPLDLRNVSAATLTFAAWYDIETDYDYAYVEASTDGGKRWEILPGQHTTTTNPVGNSFGAGWTGKSGGGDTAQWIDERIDLSPYAGKEILLRFEYVTDDALNAPGLLIDDIRVPEIGFADSGEEGNSGWEAAGWVLTDNVLEQGWLVQLVTVNRGSVQIQRLQVDADGKGQLELPNVDGFEDAVLIISALAPVTTEKATYSYNITGR